MRPAQITLLLSSAYLAHSFVPISMPIHKGRGGKAIPPPLRAEEAQRPIMDGPGPALPPGDTSNPPSDPPAGGPGTVILSDVIGKDRSINIFAGLARDVEAVSLRLDDSSQNSTVLAPLNSAMDKMPRKPWEDPEDYNKLGADAYEGDDGWQRAQRNLRRFVEAHVIPKNPWPQGEKVKALGSDNAEVWWEEKDGAKVIQPGNIEVASVASSVQNGQVWILKSVRNYS
ncbi:hypothetical protein VM1G_06226 [Cytospora mali]|uniref:FAS1 domain-containing protein n=1 Tax=Cytospora mali TaxID=578113 RepID=A0A194W3M1_CYTMA|nr:hypothetical protein VM1G_06226 [Valsa mali]